MKETRIFLVVITLLRLLQCWKKCGELEIENNKQCFCGNKVLTFDNEKIKRKKLCCGPDTCFINETGDGICPDGITCITGGVKLWNCGDVRISQEKTCQCGSSSSLLNYAQYNSGWGGKCQKMLSNTSLLIIQCSITRQSFLDQPSYRMRGWLNFFYLSLSS